MKRLLLAVALGMASAIPSWAAEPCGNLVHNLTRARECEAYTATDWGKRKDMIDIRTQVLQEWIERLPLAGDVLEQVLKNADTVRGHALVRDVQIFGKDEDMWKSRGCGDLPLCPRADPKKPTAEVNPDDEAYKPKPKAEKRRARNRRTGGNYCGPRDTARGYCD